jgi:hypothetical protein
MAVGSIFFGNLIERFKPQQWKRASERKVDQNLAIEEGLVGLGVYRGSTEDPGAGITPAGLKVGKFHDHRLRRRKLAGSVF